MPIALTSAQVFRLVSMCQRMVAIRRITATRATPPPYQQLDHHPHIHAVVPGGGPSLDNQRWVASRHPTQRRRKPYLTDNKSLGCEFRKQYVRGLRRLIRSGELRIDAEWAFLADPAKREAWLDELETTDWNVLIDCPTHGHSQPEHVIKYLARYISGGLIADRRLISDQDVQVTF